MSEPEYKAVFFDVHGTLTAPLPNAMPTRNVKNAVRDALDFGVEVSLVTGGPDWMNFGLIDYLGIESVCAFNNGSQIVDVGKVDESGSRIRIADEAISLTSQAAALEICQELGVPLYDSFHQYRFPEQPLTEVSKDQLDNTKLFVDGVQPALARDLIARINRLGDLSAVQSTSWRDVSQTGHLVDVHITFEKATKKEAVMLMCQVMGVDVEEAICVGDSHNDLAMFAVAGLSVAMNNAPDEVKAQADVVVSSREEDGVVEVFKHFVFGEFVEIAEL